jgi:hypothetical protein
MLPMETTSQNLHSHLERKVTCGPVLVALGLSPNSKSSYPSFHKASWLKKETAKITPRREGSCPAPATMMARAVGISASAP